MSFLETLMNTPGGPAHHALNMGDAILQVLTEIRDGQGEAEQQREQFTAYPFSMDVAGGTGQAAFTLHSGLGFQFSSLAFTAGATGGRVSVYAGGVSPQNLLQVVDIPAALVAGTAMAVKQFGPNDYAPENTPILVVVEGAAGDYRGAGVLRGKVFLRGDAIPTTHSDG